jgi:hypothetical protein
VFLSCTPLQGYRDWCRHVDLPERISELTLEKLREGGEAVVRWGWEESKPEGRWGGADAPLLLAG